jgi:glycosyltransferase involved in cell wall biosynthesis
LPRLQIAAVLPDAFGGYGGIALYNRDLLEAFCAMPDVDGVTALPRAISQPLEPMPAKLTYRTGAARGKAAFVLNLIANLPAFARADLIYCGHINLVPFAWLLGAVFRKPVVLAIYGIEAWQPTGRGMVDRLAPRIPHVVSISKFTAERFAAWGALPASRIRLLPNAIHLERYGTQGRAAQLAERLGLTGRTVLLTVGRLASKERAKGFDEVLDLVPELSGEIPGLVYVIAGDGDYRPELEAKVDRLGIRDRVVFTGFIPENDKPDLYRAADAYVMPSRGEGFGFVFLEAMACGTPVVASSADGSRDAVMDGELGAMVAPDDRAALKAAILEALRRPKGIPPQLEYFSFENFCERTAAVVRDALRAPEPA